MLLDGLYTRCLAKSSAACQGLAPCCATELALLQALTLSCCWQPILRCFVEPDSGDIVVVFKNTEIIKVR